MDFIHEHSVVIGVCSNLSESGLRGSFAQEVPAGSEGLLTLYHKDRKFAVKAVVDTVREEDTLVHFEFQSDKERSSIGELIKLLGTPSP